MPAAAANATASRSPRGTYVPPSLLVGSLQKGSEAASDAFASRADARFERFIGKELRDEFNDEFGIESPGARRAREEEEDRKNLWITVGHAIFASATMIASLISIRIASWGITQAAGGMAMGTSPYMVRQRRKLNRANTLREVMNQIRWVVNKLRIQNNRLTEENDKLRVQVDKLKKVEESLSDVVKRQGGDVDKFVAAVKENAAVQERMKIYLKAQAMQDAASAVLASDRDRDGRFDDEEIDMLVHRMQAHPSLRRRDGDEIRARLTSGWDRKLTTVLRKANEIYDEAGVGSLA